MRNGWLSLGVILAAFTLNACQHDINMIPPPPPPAPCVIESTLSNDPMGQLGIQIIRIGDTVRVIIPSDNVFGVKNAIIQCSAYQGLDELGAKLKSYGHGQILPMTITGYTDNIGTPDENKWVSEQQARSIATFLWTRGFCHQEFTTIAVGQDKSGTVSSNRSILGKAANRRVEITLRANPGYLGF